MNRSPSIALKNGRMVGPYFRFKGTRLYAGPADQLIARLRENFWHSAEGGPWSGIAFPEPVRVSFQNHGRESAAPRLLPMGILVLGGLARRGGHTSRCLARLDERATGWRVRARREVVICESVILEPAREARVLVGHWMQLQGEAISTHPDGL
jgi:hypothetical protein